MGVSAAICYRHLATLTVVLTLAPHPSTAAEPRAKNATAPRDFMHAKTWFQTNTDYDPRLAVATDAVVLHRHGDSLESVRRAIGSWKDHGYVVGRMFFSDSDGTNAYWKGKLEPRNFGQESKTHH